MSGGHFEYRNDYLCSDIYGWNVRADYGKDGFEQSKVARKINPLKDYIISEIVFDVFCLLHSFDWYMSCDTREETYRKDVEHFKRKWLKQIPEHRMKEIVDEEMSMLRDELYKSFGIDQIAKEMLGGTQDA